MAMLVLIVLSVVILGVAVFALQNAQAVTVRFLFWELQSSLAAVTLAATAAGVVIAARMGPGQPLLELEARPPRIQ